MSTPTATAPKPPSLTPPRPRATPKPSTPPPQPPVDRADGPATEAGTSDAGATLKDGLTSAFENLGNLGTEETPGFAPKTGDPSLTQRPGEGPYEPANFIIPEDYDPHAPTVVVADDFNEKVSDHDDDGEADGTHGGNIARSYATRGFNTIGYQTPVDDGNQLDRNLLGLAQDVGSGAIELPPETLFNFSHGQERNFETMSQQFGLELTPENLASQREALHERMLEVADQSFDNPEALYQNFEGEPPEGAMNSTDLWRTLDRIDATKNLQSMGHRVIAAGANEGGSTVFDPGNMFADRITSGIVDASGTPMEGTQNDSLTTPTRSVFTPTQLTDENGQPLGLSIDGDDYSVEYRPEELSSGGASPYVQNLAGNSYGTPALAEHLFSTGEWFLDYPVLTEKPVAPPF